MKAILKDGRKISFEKKLFPFTTKHLQIHWVKSINGKKEKPLSGIPVCNIDTIKCPGCEMYIPLERFKDINPNCISEIQIKSNSKCVLCIILDKKPKRGEKK